MSEEDWDAFDDALLYEAMYGDEEKKLTRKQAKQLQKQNKRIEKQNRKIQEQNKRIEAELKEARDKDKTGGGDAGDAAVGCLIIISIIGVLILVLVGFFS